MEYKFRDLTKDEIEVRVQSANDKGVILLLYKDARVDMNILDETVGPDKWQRDHFECKGNLFCKIGIKQEDGSWVWKADCGVESNTEAQKGEASDSFKRAGFNWGIGRELYTSPFVWIGAKDCNLNSADRGGKTYYSCYDKFIVQKIKIENKIITGLAILNTTTGKTCYVYCAPGSEKQAQ